MAYGIFISSAPRDRDLAENIAQSVREAGAEVLSVAQTPDRGEVVSFDLHRALRKADEIVFIPTDRSLNNPYLIYEMGAAFSMRKRFTSILVGVEDSEIPPLIAHLPYLRYSELRRYLSELEQRAKSPDGESPRAAAR